MVASSPRKRAKLIEIGLPQGTGLMAQGDKKTKRGIGGLPPEQEPRHSDVPTSHLRENSRNGSSDASETTPVSAASPSERDVKATQPGMPRLQKKVVTKVGVAPPSEPPPAPDLSPPPLTPRSAAAADKLRTNPGLSAPPPLDQMQFEHEGGASDDADRISSREEYTPREGSKLKASNEEEDAGDRSRFRTAPGGGRNRVSGGRAQAAAYVSPSTLPPEQGKDHITSAIKVDEVVRNAVRAYETEPSLLRRRASSLPPRPATPPPKRTAAVLVLGALVLGLVLGASILWAAMNSLRAKEQLGIAVDSEGSELLSDSPALVDATSSEPPVKAPGKAKVVRELPGNEPSARVQPTAASSPSADSSPSAGPLPSATKTVTSAQTKQPLAPSNQEQAPQEASPSGGTNSTRGSKPPVAPKAPSPPAPPSDLWLE